MYKYNAYMDCQMMSCRVKTYENKYTLILHVIQNIPFTLYLLSFFLDE